MADDLDFDFDLDFGDDLDFDTDRLLGKNKDSPIRALAKSTARSTRDSIFEKVKSKSFIRDQLKAFLPRQYGDIIDALDKTYDTAEDLYNQSARTLRDPLRSLAKEVDLRISDESKKSKRISQKIREMLGEDSTSQTKTPEELREELVQKTLTETLGTDKRSRLESRGQFKLSFRQQTVSNQLLSSINTTMYQLARFTTTQTAAYQKKSLELSLRSYLVQADLLRTASESFRMLTEQNKILMHNTSLPDINKLTSALAKDKSGSVRKFLGKAGYSLFNRSGALDNLLNRLKTSTLDKVQSMAGGIDSAVFNMEMIRESGLSKRDLFATILGSMAGDGILGYLSGKASPHVKKFVEKHGGRFNNKAFDIAKYLHNPNAGMRRAMTDLFNKLDPEIGEYGTVKGGFKAMLSDIVYNAIPGARNFSLDRGRGYKNLQQPAIFTTRTQRSITDIIPGYLSHIWREIKMLRTGDSNTPLMTYDHRNERFIASGRQQGQLRRQLKESMNINRVQSETSSVANKIIGENNLSPGAREALKKVVLNNVFDENIGDIKDFLNERSYRGVSTEHATEIQNLIKSRYIKNGQHDKDAEYDLTKSIAGLANTVTDPRELISDMVDAGYDKELIQLGILKPTRSGFNIDRHKLQDLLLKSKGHYEKTGPEKRDTTSAFVKIINDYMKGKKNIKEVVEDLKSVTKKNLQPHAKRYYRKGMVKATRGYRNLKDNYRDYLDQAGGYLDQASQRINSSETAQNIRRKYTQYIEPYVIEGQARAEDAYERAKGSAVWDRLQGGWKNAQGAYSKTYAYTTNARYRNLVNNETAAAINELKKSTQQQAQQYREEIKHKGEEFKKSIQQSAEVAGVKTRTLMESSPIERILQVLTGYVKDFRDFADHTLDVYVTNPGSVAAGGQLEEEAEEGGENGSVIRKGLRRGYKRMTNKFSRLTPKRFLRKLVGVPWRSFNWMRKGMKAGKAALSPFASMLNPLNWLSTAATVGKASLYNPLKGLLKEHGLGLLGLPATVLGRLLGQSGKMLGGLAHLGGSGLDVLGHLAGGIPGLAGLLTHGLHTGFNVTQSLFSPFKNLFKGFGGGFGLFGNGKIAKILNEIKTILNDRLPGEKTHFSEDGVEQAYEGSWWSKTKQKTSNLKNKVKEGFKGLREKKLLGGLGTMLSGAFRKLSHRLKNLKKSQGGVEEDIKNVAELGLAGTILSKGKAVGKWLGSGIGKLFSKAKGLGGSAIEDAAKVVEDTGGWKKVAGRLLVGGGEVLGKLSLPLDLITSGYYVGKLGLTIHHAAKQTQLNPFEAIRMAQYGFKDTFWESMFGQTDWYSHIGAIRSLEMYIERYIVPRANGSVYIHLPKNVTLLILKNIFNLDVNNPTNKVAIDNFGNWLVNRFGPAYLANYTILKSVNAKAHVPYIGRELTPPQKHAYLTQLIAAVRAQKGVYNVKTTPFPGWNINAGFDDVISAIRKAFQTVKTENAQFKSKQLGAHGANANAFIGAYHPTVVNKNIRQTIINAAKKVGVNPALLMTIAGMESGFDPNAQAGTSSAGGAFQFVNGTWDRYMIKYGRKYHIAPGTTQYNLKASALMAAQMIKNHRNALQGVTGGKVSPTDLYLAHFLGADGAKKFLEAKGNTVAAQLLPDAASANQEIFYSSNGTPRTVDQVKSLFRQRMQRVSQNYNTGLQVSPSSATRLKNLPFVSPAKSTPSLQEASFVSPRPVGLGTGKPTAVTTDSFKHIKEMTSHTSNIRQTLEESRDLHAKTYEVLADTLGKLDVGTLNTVLTAYASNIKGSKHQRLATEIPPPSVGLKRASSIS